MEETKQKTPHRQFIEYFSDTTLKARGFRPKITGKDAIQLKRVLESGIKETTLEQLALYFIAGKRFKNMSPSIGTMLSATVLNALLNYMHNREDFYKELDGLIDKSRRTEMKKENKKVDVAGIETQIKMLREKLSLKY